MQALPIRASEQSTEQCTGPSERPSARQRQAAALEARARGLTYREVAVQCGYRGPGGAFAAVQRALADVQIESVDLLRQLEGQRLDMLWISAWTKAEGGDVQSQNVCLRISERKAHLFGLDRDGKLTEAARDALIEAVVRTVREFVVEDDDRQTFADRLLARVR